MKLSITQFGLGGILNGSMTGETGVGEKIIINCGSTTNGEPAVLRIVGSTGDEIARYIFKGGEGNLTIEA